MTNEEHSYPIVQVGVNASPTSTDTANFKPYCVLKETMTETAGLFAAVSQVPDTPKEGQAEVKTGLCCTVELQRSAHLRKL